MPKPLRTALVALAIAIAAWYGVRMALGISMARKLYVCMERGPHPTPPLSVAQRRKLLEDHIACVDHELNFFERWFFDKDDAMASIRVE